ncbi:hypothetical protein AAHE18_09G059400 [Arachis hypogaea]
MTRTLHKIIVPYSQDSSCVVHRFNSHRMHITSSLNLVAISVDITSFFFSFLSPSPPQNPSFAFCTYCSSSKTSQSPHPQKAKPLASQKAMFRKDFTPVINTIKINSTRSYVTIMFIKDIISKFNSSRWNSFCNS